MGKKISEALIDWFNESQLLLGRALCSQSKRKVWTFQQSAWERKKKRNDESPKNSKSILKYFKKSQEKSVMNEFEKSKEKFID